MMRHTARGRAAWFVTAVTGSLLAAVPTHAWAWGHTGHVEVSHLAILNLPAELPGFLRSARSAAQIGELGAEPDESKTTGIVTGVGDAGRIQTTPTVHDAERDPGHYVDIDDSGFVLGGAVPLAWFKKCHFQVTPEIDRAVMVKGFLVLGVTLI